MKNTSILVALVAFLLSSIFVIADCPTADVTGDCFVDLEDFAEMANQWLTGDPCVPDDMVYIPYGGFGMGNHFDESGEDELPLHAVLLDSFFMSKYEITNQQYCDYLNSAYPGQIKVVSGVVYASSDSSNSYPYFNTRGADADSQIDFSDPDFRVMTKGASNRDMSDDPLVGVSWYGATAYCNWRSGQEGYESCYNLSTWACDFSKHGYRLPTEAEWEYAARGGLSGKRFPWGDTISHTQANYWSYWEHGSPSYPFDVSPTELYHPLWDDDFRPYTSPVGFFDGTMKYRSDYNWNDSATSYQTTSGANGYGLYDIAGNVWELCNDWSDYNYYDTSPYDNPTGPASGTHRTNRGGSYTYNPTFCTVSRRSGSLPSYRSHNRGFRLVLDLE